MSRKTPINFSVSESPDSTVPFKIKARTVLSHRWIHWIVALFTADIRLLYILFMDDGALRKNKKESLDGFEEEMSKIMSKKTHTAIEQLLRGDF